MKTDIQITNIQIGVLIAGKVWWRNSITVHRKSSLGPNLGSLYSGLNIEWSK